MLQFYIIKIASIVPRFDWFSKNSNLRKFQTFAERSIKFEFKTRNKYFEIMASMLPQTPRLFFELRIWSKSAIDDKPLNQIPSPHCTK